MIEHVYPSLFLKKEMIQFLIFSPFCTFHNYEYNINLYNVFLIFFIFFLKSSYEDFDFSNWILGSLKSLFYNLEFLELLIWLFEFIKKKKKKHHFHLQCMMTSIFFLYPNADSVLYCRKIKAAKQLSSYCML